MKNPVYPIINKNRVQTMKEEATQLANTISENFKEVVI